MINFGRTERSFALKWTARTKRSIKTFLTELVCLWRNLTEINHWWSNWTNFDSLRTKFDYSWSRFWLNLKIRDNFDCIWPFVIKIDWFWPFLTTLNWIWPFMTTEFDHLWLNFQIQSSLATNGQIQSKVVTNCKIQSNMATNGQIQSKLSWVMNDQIYQVWPRIVKLN